MSFTISRESAVVFRSILSTEAKLSRASTRGKLQASIIRQLNKVLRIREVIFRNSTRWFQRNYFHGLLNITFNTTRSRRHLSLWLSQDSVDGKIPQKKGWNISREGVSFEPTRLYVNLPDIYDIDTWDLIRVEILFVGWEKGRTLALGIPSL